ncbi:related to SEC18-Vesicular-fusion protein, functional homolog of NSF [Serendipita indica DSM 11827]|uniref:Vesicular-fusion protein SEC18 n=1 Tax=Serendipita indica (strain DSM 11827) TaxID=1109443 RepID=G4TH72_SERID|nr:related to SEC18-Vesicular-fusion protein, functional homolog of NSF [Serendipita indica DSM 11827]
MSWLRGNAPQQPPPQQGGYSRLPPGAGGGIPSGPRAGREQPPPQQDSLGGLLNRWGPSYGEQSPAMQYQGGRGGGGSSRTHARTFIVKPSPTDADSQSNRLLCHPNDFQEGEHVLVQQRYAMTIKRDMSGILQPGQVGLSMVQRQWALVNENDSISISIIDIRELGKDVILAAITIDLGFMRAKRQVDDVFSIDDLSDFIHRQFDRMMFSPDQVLYFEYHGHKLKATVRATQNVGVAPREGYGQLDSATDITIMKAADSGIKFKSSAKKPPPNAILAPNFRFEDVGIGGLDVEFAAIFRRAFASRMFPRGLVEKLGIRHVKGLLLYGPPGTGKTLMARQIGKMLNAREPKIVNGPEILSKYVGASEENYKEKGDDSELHIIIFDELDAITKQRGSTNSGTGVGDTVVNQLLSKMDGVDQLNNILIIGMTNRKDMIDEALLRPGRLEVHVEISLPDESGRLQILKIHTAKMTKEGVMAEDVSLPDLASKTKNFSGAEIEGLVGTTAGISDDIDQLRVTKQDFELGLTEVQPAFGVSEEEFAGLALNGIIGFDESIESIKQNARLLVEQVRTSEKTPLVSVLLHGLPGTGKTALAAHIAQNSEYPFIKLVTPEKMVGYSEQQKVQAIHKIFNDSYKSPLSVIVVDNIERLIDWAKIGSRFSNAVVQTLMVLMTRRPPMGRKLLVLATTSNRAMVEELEMAELFDSEMRVGPVSSLRGVEVVLESVDALENPQERRQVMQDIEDAFRPRTREEQALYGATKLSIGVKKLINLAEMAKLDPGQVGARLVSSLIEQAGGGASKPPARRRVAEGEPESPGYYGISM